jgi:hypothetical protein
MTVYMSFTELESRTQVLSCLEIEVTSKLSLLNATVCRKTIMTCLANPVFIQLN